RLVEAGAADRGELVVVGLEPEAVQGDALEVDAAGEGLVAERLDEARRPVGRRRQQWVLRVHAQDLLGQAGQRARGELAAHYARLERAEVLGIVDPVPGDRQIGKARIVGTNPRIDRAGARHHIALAGGDVGPDILR